MLAYVPYLGKESDEEGNPSIIFGDGEPTRDFTFVKDVVTANIRAAESELTGIFNIGRGERNSINCLAKLNSRLMGNSITPVHEQLRPGDVAHSLADISRARTFGYDPKYGLEEGLKQTYREFRRGA